MNIFGWVFALVIGVVLPFALFSVLPPHDRLDRWFIAHLFVGFLPFGMLVCNSLWRNGWKVIWGQFLLSFSALGLSFWSFGGVGSVDARRYCEADQYEARRAMRKATHEGDSSDACSKAADTAAQSFATRGRERFAFTGRPNAGACVLVAEGKDLQQGCNYTLSATSQLEGTLRCSKVCR